MHPHKKPNGSRDPVKGWIFHFESPAVRRILFFLIAAQDKEREDEKELRFRSRARAHARLHIEKDKRDTIAGDVMLIRNNRYVSRVVAHPVS